MRIALFRNAQDNAPAFVEATWDELAADLSKHQRTDCAPCAGHDCKAKNGPAWSPADAPDGARRLDANVRALSVLVFDLDGEHARANLDATASALGSTAYLAHSTHSGTGFRVVIPLSRPVSAADWPRFWRAAVERFCPAADPTCRNLFRIYFFPSAPQGMSVYAEQRPGEPLDPAKILGDAPAGEPAPVAPVRNPSAELGSGNSDHARDLEALCQIQTPAAQELARKVKAGEALAEPGTRDTALQSAAGVLAFLPEPLSAERALSLLDPCIRAMPTEPEGVEFWLSAAREKYTRALERRKLEDAKASQTAAEIDRVLPPAPPGEAADPDARAPDGINPGELIISEPGNRPLTDRGLAERFYDAQGERLAYVPAWGRWFVFENVWTPDERMLAERAFGEAMRDIQRREALHWKCKGFEEKADKLWKLGIYAESGKGASHGFRFSKEYFAVDHTRFDADPWLFACANGTIDLKTGALRENRREDFITKTSPVAYDPNATCPEWERFLARVLPDANSRSYLQRCVGYALTGDTSEQKLFFLYGEGANGKSTFLTTLQYLFGGHAKQAAGDLLISKQTNAHPTELADLMGSRLVVCSELEEGRSFDEQRVKQLTGQDVIKARYMRQDFFEFVPTHKLFIAGNHKPSVRGTELAIWRRIQLVPWVVQIPEHERDKRLFAKLKAEAPGILAWAVRGCLDWQTRGLSTPMAIQEATDTYRESEDLVGQFLEEMTLREPSATATAVDLYLRYCQWSEARGEKPWSAKRLGPHLHRHGLERVHTSKGKAWKGCRLRGAVTVGAE